MAAIRPAAGAGSMGRPLAKPPLAGEGRLLTLTTTVTAPGSTEARIEADLGFHVLLRELSGNSMLVQTWRHPEGPPAWS